MNNKAENTSSKRAGKSSISNNNSDNDVDYKNNAKIDNSRSKSTSNKNSDIGNK